MLWLKILRFDWLLSLCFHYKTIFETPYLPNHQQNTSSKSTNLMNRENLSNTQIHMLITLNHASNHSFYLANAKRIVLNHYALILIVVCICLLRESGTSVYFYRIRRSWTWCARNLFLWIVTPELNLKFYFRNTIVRFKVGNCISRND